MDEVKRVDKKMRVHKGFVHVESRRHHWHGIELMIDELLKVQRILSHKHPNRKLHRYHSNRQHEGKSKKNQTHFFSSKFVQNETYCYLFGIVSLKSKDLRLNMKMVHILIFSIDLQRARNIEKEKIEISDEFCANRK